MSETLVHSYQLLSPLIDYYAKTDSYISSKERRNGTTETPSEGICYSGVMSVGGSSALGSWAEFAMRGQVNGATISHCPAITIMCSLKTVTEYSNIFHSSILFRLIVAGWRWRPSKGSNSRVSPQTSVTPDNSRKREGPAPPQEFGSKALAWS